ncbi:MAG: decaprenyl-phosphate phosphoribosyltransferase [Fimbriimonadaceae bacterium]|nr:decaprenyl-phosphate phosphoribosyltransferase [Fimbriimonadaceae bacterium]
MRSPIILTRSVAGTVPASNLGKFLPGPVMNAVLRLARPRQWTKNLLLLAALVFAGRFSDPVAWKEAGLAFLAFVLASAGVYAWNDAYDAPQDRNHPKKKNRPVASGAISAPLALTFGISWALAGIVVAYIVRFELAAWVAVYLVIQVGYTLGLKHVNVLDVFLVASGFVIRAAAGGVAINAYVSNWLLFCTGALALMLVTAKRRQEFRSSGGEITRKSLDGYSERALDALVLFSATLAALAYCIYAIESENALRTPLLIVTTPFVLFGIARYLVLVFGQDIGEEPEEVLLTDRWIQAAVLGFIIFSVVAVSGQVDNGSATVTGPELAPPQAVLRPTAGEASA